MRTNRNDVLVNPAVVIKLIDHAVEDTDPKKIIKDRVFAITREAWIAAVFLLGNKAITKIPWWLRVNPEENSVEDIQAASYTPLDASGSIQHVLSIQVFQHTRQSIGNVIDGIKKKLASSDLSNCVLVCYLMKTERVKWNDLNEEINKLIPSAREIWVIGNTGGRKFIVFQVFPNLNYANIDLDEIDIPESEPRFIKPIRISRNEASKIGSHMHPLGKRILLRPNFSFLDI